MLKGFGRGQEIDNHFRFNIMKKNNIFRILLTIVLVPGLIAAVTACTLLGYGNKGSETMDNTQAEVESTGVSGESSDEKDEGQALQDTPLKLCVDDSIPGDIREALMPYLEGDLNIEYIGDRQEADVCLEMVPAGAVNAGSGISSGLDINYVLAPVTPFFNITDGILWQDFKDWWSGDENALAYISGGDGMPVLELDENNYNLLVKILGEPRNGNIRKAGQPVSADEEDGSNTGFSIVPFDHIRKQMKVLEINGFSVFDRELELADYPFAFSARITGKDENDVDKISGSLKDFSYNNRDLTRMTSLIMTGVTAMVRGTAQRMENNGITYPGEEIAEILKSVDITHISNEVPFVEDCDVLTNRFPIFCSKPEYVELLEYVGTDVVELTGNHMNDHGYDWFIYTLDMYDELGWPYYGGGRDLEEAYSPAILESNGNCLAFLGFNWWGPAYDWATADTPGSAPPNFEDFESIIGQLKQQGYIVIFTFQYYESYQYEPVAQQVIDFRRMVDAGADIVSGSQSHYPQGMEFYQDGFINYGLGNLFFDQMFIPNTTDPSIRQELIVKHIFYGGEHINTVIITAMLEDYSQPRLAEPGEREQILTEVFNASIK